MVESPSSDSTGSNLVDMGRTSSARPPSAGDSDPGRCLPARRPRGKPAAYSWRGCRGKLGTYPADRCVVNVGTIPLPPSPPASQAGGGQARRRLLARDGTEPS